MKQLYIDCDGVLADFDSAAEEVLGLHPQAFEDQHGEAEMWRILSGTTDFYGQLPLMLNGRALFNALQRYNPVILTGQPPRGWAAQQKLQWRDRYFPGVKMIVCASRDKRNYCKPGDVLVDDRAKYSHLWREAGGVFIHYDEDKPLALVVQKVHNAMRGGAV